jgi:hypothetical protein
VRGLTSTILLIVVLAGLGGYIYFIDSKRSPAGLNAEAAKEKVYAVETDKIDEIKITAGGETSLLKKSDAGWKMIEPAATDADPAEAIGVAQAIAGLERVRVVDDNPKDLAQYGLENPAVRIDFKTQGNVSGSLKLGDKNTTQGELYAQKNNEKAVFLVPAFQENSLNRKPFDLRDKKILKFDRDKADAIAIVRGPSSIELARSGTEWKVVKPTAGRSDYAAVEGLLSKLSSANMSKLIETDAKDLAKYGLDKPAMTITVGAGSSKTVLEIGKNEKDQTYARDASRPLVFTVDTTLQDDLKKSLDDYRKKELFEFRPFLLAKLRAVLDTPGGGKTYEFEKAKGAKPNDPDTWKVTRVGGETVTADQAAMDDLLNKLVALKAESWVDAKTRTGLDKPALVVSASYDEGKFERVRFGQVGDNAYASRDGEAGVVKVDTPSTRGALMAFDTVVMPPKPPATPTTPDKAGEKK